MYPKRMEKVEIDLLKKDHRAVLDAIRSARIIEAVDLSTPKEGAVDPELTTFKVRIERLIEALAPHEPPTKGLMNLLGRSVERIHILDHELKPSLIRWLKEVEGEVLKVDSRLKGIQNDLEASSDIRQRLLQLTGLNVNLNDLRHFHFVKIRIGLTRRFSELERIMKEVGGSVQGSLLDRREGLHAVRIAYLVSRSGKIEEQLKGKIFSDLSLDIPRIESFLTGHGAEKGIMALSISRVLEEFERIDGGLLKRREEVERKAGELAVRHLLRSRAFGEAVDIALERERLGSLLGSTVYTVKLTGWVESARIPELRSLLQNACGHHYHLTHRPPTAEECDGDKVPTIMGNRWLGRLFEPLALTYSTPKYNEIDPSTWMAVPFIVIFGIMLGDMGYASLLIIGGIFLISKSPKVSRMRDIGWLVLLLGISGAVAGLWMGSVFGDLFSRIIYGDPTHSLYSLEIAGYRLPYDSIREPMLLFMLAMVIGLAEVNLGFFLLGADRVKKGQHFGMVKGAVSWVLIQIGGIIFIGALLIKAWELNTTLTIIGAGSFLVGFVLLTFEAKGMVVFSIEGLMGDIISYTRILALGLSTFGLAMAFNIIAEIMMDISWVMLPVVIVLLLALHLMNFLIQVFGSFVHTLRLQFVEFFGKFFEGGGRLFQPFGRERIYTLPNDQRVQGEGQR